MIFMCYLLQITVCYRLKWIHNKNIAMVLSMDRWVGKIAVVTGAASGIGKAIVESLVHNGLIVVGLGRRVQLIEQHSQQLSKAKGKLYAVKADITQETDILNAFKWISDQLGPVHVLINSAAMFYECALAESTFQELQTQFNTNVIGLCVVSREAIKIMRSNKINGHIININSITGHKVPPSSKPSSSAYSATKFAITSITELLRQELNNFNTKIRITSISPGLTATEMTIYRKDNTEQRRKFLESKPILQAEDVADSVVYVLSTPEHVQVHELTIKPIGEPY